MASIGIVGAGGRMGRLLVRETEAHPGAELVGAIGRSEDPEPLFRSARVVIDFTTPEGSARYATLAAETGAALVIGTTGIGPAQQAAIDAAAERTVIVQAANFSIGVNLLAALVERAARTLDPIYDIEVLEMHHRHKVDAPSGTALWLGQAAADGRAVDLEEASVRSRDGHTGPRQQGTIGFATLRGGDVVGEHQVIFAGPGERIELGHRATDRGIFAAGAVRAALWAVGRPAGKYGMPDVLGID